MNALQTTTLRAYGELLARTPAGGWAGKLVITAAPQDELAAWATASCIAGACCLQIDPDSAPVRAQLRDGGVDFIVNTLDEAVRVLKNEIRQRRPLAVALIAQPEETIVAANERGLLADLSVGVPALAAKAVCPAQLEPTQTLTDWLGQRRWSEQVLPEAAVIPTFQASDPRAAWLRLLPRYQRSSAQAPRWIWLDPDGR